MRDSPAGTDRLTASWQGHNDRGPYRPANPQGPPQSCRSPQARSPDARRRRHLPRRGLRPADTRSSGRAPGGTLRTPREARRLQRQAWQHTSCQLATWHLGLLLAALPGVTLPKPLPRVLVPGPATGDQAKTGQGQRSPGQKGRQRPPCSRTIGRGRGGGGERRRR